MLVLARKTAAGLFGVLLLAPLLQALPVGGEEDNCVHLVGYGGAPSQGQKRTTRPSNPQADQLAAGICAVDNARGNNPNPVKTNADYVPVTGDDALGFYCIYGVRASTTGGVAGNVCIYLLPLNGGEVLLYGSGYGNIAGANLFDAAYDMERVDQVLRFCMGRDPATTPLRILAPHGHGDHINPACNRELERLGYRILEIAFHPGDTAAVSAMAWTNADRALFRVLPNGTTCLQELASYASPLGKLWVYHRPGHTAGSIDLVIDILNDPTNRMVVRGSQPSSPCAPISGQREIINAHGNVELLSVGPRLDDVSPQVGTSLGGTPLTLTGLNFQAEGAGTPRVLVAGAPCTNVVVVNDTTLTCKTPAGPPGQLVDVVLVDNNGQSLFPGTYFYTAQPTLTTLSPANGDWRGGTVVQLRGTGFLLTTGLNDVLFGSKKSPSVSVKSDTLLTCRTPAGTPGTNVNVTLSNTNGQATLLNAFHYDADLAITGVQPNHASALGGTAIVLTGSSFTGSGAAPSVSVGGAPATTVSLLSDTSVSCVVPTGTPGSTADIVLTNSAGTATFTGFRYHATPNVGSVAPTGGFSTGGTLVTLSGTGFVIDGAGPCAVRFGGIPATAVSVLNDGALTCRTPAGVAGTVANVTVTNQNGTATLPLAFTYSQPLTGTSLLPSSGTSLGGTQVTIAGSGFLDGPAGPTSVLFGAAPGTAVAVQSDSLLTCLAPAGTPLAVVDVRITNANGTVVLPSAYRFNRVPVLSSVSPNHGHAGGSTPVTVTGSGFQDDDAGFALLVVGGVAASDVVVVSDTTLACVIGPGTPGAVVDVLLVNQNGSSTLSNGFRYHTAPTLASVSPADGAANNPQRVTLTGTGFLDDSAGVPTITFGGVAATSVSVTGDQSLRCNVPSGTAGARVNVVLANARGSATLGNGYRYHARPALTAATPNRGTFQGNTAVTLGGSGFSVDGAGTNVVTFGGILATNVVVLNDGSLSCKTPPGALNAVVDVIVSNANGTGTLVQGFSYSVPPPAITALVPASGPAHAPGSVQLNGSGFQANSAGSNAVTFGGVASGIVGLLDDARLTCQVPPGAPGTRVDVVVTNANGSGQLVQGFRYHARPTLSALAPAGASSLGGATIQLTGAGFQVDAAGTNLVTFGGVPAASVTVLGDGTLSCVAPAGTPGSLVQVLVHNANGDTATQPFQYFAQPSLLAVTPPFGPVSGATRVTLTGLGLQANGAGPNAVTFGGVAARNVLVVNDTTLTCETPRGSSGYVDIGLSNANGTALLPDGFHFGKLPPAITSVTPASGPPGGQNLVTLKGRGFTGGGANRVKFGAVLSTNVITVDDETVLCIAPPGTPGTTVDLGLNNTTGTVTAPQAYRYHTRPVLLAVTPPEGQPLGATKVTLSGSGFTSDSPGTTVVLFDSVRSRDVLVLDDSHITCTALGGPPGSVLDVTVRNDNGSSTLPDAYRVLGGPPAISDLVPDDGPFTGGTLVEIHGSGLAGGGLRVTFGGAPATNVVVQNDALLTCFSPPGVIEKSVTVQLSTKDGTAAMLGGFTYRAIVPKLTGVSPNHGPASGGTRVTLSGSGFAALGAGTTQVLFGTIPAANLTVLDDTTVACDAPAGTPGTTVSIELDNGNGSDSLAAAFRYHDRPTLSALAPQRGPELGGTTVTLSGTGFTVDGPGATQVRFGAVAAQNVVVLNNTSLTCTTPSGTGTVDVVLSNRNGSATLPAAFRYVPAPVLTALTPARGPEAGGTTLTLSGRGFTAEQAGTNTVTIGGAPALDVVTLSDDTLLCRTPAGLAGARDVRLSNANGSTTAVAAFTYFRVPSLTALTPTRGPAEGGTSVTLSGSGFLAAGAGANLVLFGGVAAQDVVELSDTSLSCTAPPGTAGTTVDVTLANENGVATLVAGFGYHGAPQITGVTPAHGPKSGAKVTLTGSGFLNDAAGTNTVTFGGLPATQVVVVDDGTLLCRVPAGAPGTTVDAALVNANGSSAFPAAFRYHAEPTLASVTPNRGTSNGGTSVTVVGSGFVVDAPGPMQVIFGGFAAVSVAVVNDTTLTCVTPSGHPSALINVTVANDNGQNTKDNAFRYNPLPTLTSVSPTSGGAPGGTLVTLNGTGFQLGVSGPNTVRFGATPATDVTVVNDTTLTCKTPAGTGGAVVDVSLDNTNGGATLLAAYRFNPVPVLSALAPTDGSALGGTLVTLLGSGFADASAGEPLVTFGGVLATDVLVLDDGHVQCTTPPGPGGALVDVVLANANGVVSLPGAFRYHALPVLTAAVPARGSSAASSHVTLLGAGFVSQAAGVNLVRFGLVPATNVVVLDDGTLSCDVAPQAAGTVVGVTLGNDNGSVTLAAGFAFDAPAPVLATVSPASGVFLGGTSVTLGGGGFLNFSAGANTVTFGGVAASNVVVVDDATLTCQTPPGTLGAAVDVTVANVNGSATRAAAFSYIAPAPALTALAPNSGPALGGTTVTLNGSGFQLGVSGANAVSFGGVAATAVSVLSDTQLTCLAPAGTPGALATVALTNSNGTAQLSSAYRYFAQPTLTSLSPVDGTSLGGTLVTLRGTGFLNDAPGTNAVRFGGLSATSVVVVDDTRLTCRVPSGVAGSIVNVSLTNANGAATLVSAFRYHQKPVLAVVTPGDGSALGGNRVTLSGSGFQVDGAVVNVVSFGGITATGVSVLNDATIQCNVPAGTGGLAVQITVANVNGTALLAGGYRYHAKPTVTALAPVGGPTGGGTSVTLTGTGFQLDAPGTNTVRFGGVAATAVNALSDTQLTCLTPAGAAGAVVDVTLTNANGTGTLFGAYTYDLVPAPIVASALPGKGTTQGSTTVTLGGSGFVPGVTVSFGAAAASDVVVLDEHTLTCLTPAVPAGAWVDVTVTQPGTLRSATLPFGFQYFVPPALRAIQPPFGLPEGGTLVVLEGEGFADTGAGAHQVSFAGTPALTVTVLDDQHLAVEIPAGPVLADADVVVSNDNGTASLAQAFRWRYELATDLDSDGRGDLILTAPGDDTLTRDAGAVKVFLGGALPLLDRTSSAADLTLVPEHVGTGFGMPLAAGDLDGDGHAELLIGAPNEDVPARDAGSVFVFGGPLAPSSTPIGPAQASTVRTGALQGERFGSALFLHDFDRNGVLDLLVGAPGRTGSVHLFLTAQGGLPAQPTLVAFGQASEGYATALAGGDLDGDGWPEIVVGAPSALGGGTSRPGAVRVFRGGPATFASSNPTPWLTFTGELNGDRFGEALAVVDLSGDGLDDLVVGAPQSARTGASSGAVFVFFGRSDLAGGDVNAADATLAAESAGDRLGSTLAVGDVNRDGHGDLALGAPGHAGAGRAYLFFGGGALSSRPVASADAVLDAETGTQGEFASKVALIDVDGNGREDLIVTAPGLDAFGIDLGRVYVFAASTIQSQPGENNAGTLTGTGTGEQLGKALSADH